ncbi:MAG: barstar family protein [Lachnospiraceae bacterium]|nr:barstar family protein [Lachnospiraceae bacterium]
MFRQFFLDFTKVHDRDGLHDYLKTTFSFPDYYGRNLDALYEALSDIMEDSCISIYAEGMMEADHEFSNYLRKAITVFKDAEAENDHIAVVVIDEFGA